MCRTKGNFRLIEMNDRENLKLQMLTRRGKYYEGCYFDNTVYGINTVYIGYCNDLDDNEIC